MKDIEAGHTYYISVTSDVHLEFSIVVYNTIVSLKNGIPLNWIMNNPT